jgi:hypothetical protein
LGTTLADHLMPAGGRLQVAIDGAAATAPGVLAESLVSALHGRGRPAVHIHADHFLRDASVRLEYGHTDTHSLLYAWYDLAALQREVLDPVAAGRDYLPSLRDPVTNRATRAARQPAPPDLVLVLSGAFLLGHALPLDRAIHLSMSAAALARHTPPDQAWTLPAVAVYEEETAPAEQADIDIRLNDPRHPAIRIRIC